MKPLEIIEIFLSSSEVIAAIVCTVCFFLRKNTILKYLLLVLWLVVITEYLSNLKFIFYKNDYNFWLYNIMFPTWKFIYLQIFYKVLKNVKYKNWVKMFSITYGISLIINWFFLENFLTHLESYSRIVASLLLTITAIFYLFELLKSDKIIVFHKELMFWVSIGLLIYNSASIPFIIMRRFYSKLLYIHNIFIIEYLLLIMMYLLFTFGFIWSKKE